MTYEYRIVAVYKPHTPYLDRSYKRKIMTSEKEALELLKEAEEYYWSVPYAKYLDHVEIQRREVSEWETSK